MYSLSEQIRNSFYGEFGVCYAQNFMLKTVFCCLLLGMMKREKTKEEDEAEYKKKILSQHKPYAMEFFRLYVSHSKSYLTYVIRSIVFVSKLIFKIENPVRYLHFVTLVK